MTNIPTPYRLFQFRVMHAELERRGWAFEVWFMARSEPRRSWTFDPAEFDFPHRFLSGFQFRIGSDSFHFNPEVLTCLRCARPEILLIAGGWALPTVWLAGMSANARKIFWSESHLASMRENGFPIRLARGFLLRRFHEFAVPGRLAQEYVEAHVMNPKIHLLPNLVDPVIFRDHVRALRRQRMPGSRRVLLITARLAPEKGLVPFLDSLQLLKAGDRSKLCVVIAGSGPLFSDLQRRTASYDFEVRLIGNRSQSEMAMLYADADGFCLPSLSDPNPLAVIEALWAGLPLLLSTRVGNHPECLVDGENGFLFAPVRQASVSEAVSRWLNLSKKQIAEFGENSFDLALTSFDPEMVVRQFLDDLMPESSSISGRSEAMIAAG